MAQLLFQDDRFEVAQRGAHVLEALPKANEFVLDHLLAETGVEQPRLQVLHVPSIERDLRNAVLTEHMRDILVRNRAAGRRLQKPFAAQVS